MKRTPLYDAHVKLGGQMVEFAGYAMPVRYASEKAEHFAVRKAAGLFDVSHMGEIFLLGPKACEAADLLLTNDIGKALVGQAVYTVMLNNKAGIVDDIVAYKFSSEKILLCVNASNRAKDFAWVQKIVESHFQPAEVRVEDVGDAFAQLALQGPKAEEILKSFVSFDLKDLKRFYFCETTLHVGAKTIAVILARTGYTGEDGFEIFVPPEHAEILWRHLLEVGAVEGLMACGLSARDTLRLEAGMCLYGNDIDDETSPLEAGLAWVVKWEKPVSFFAQPVLKYQKEQGISRRLVGLVLSDRNIARSHYEVVDANQNVIGQVTSGTLSPTLNYPIAMAYVQKPFAEVGTTVYVKIRQNLAAAVVTKLPFYKKGQS